MLTAIPKMEFNGFEEGGTFAEVLFFADGRIILACAGQTTFLELYLAFQIRTLCPSRVTQLA